MFEYLIVLTEQTVFRLHCRAGWHRIQLYKLLSKAGFHVVTFDYRGKMFHLNLFNLLNRRNAF